MSNRGSFRTTGIGGRGVLFWSELFFDGYLCNVDACGAHVYLGVFFLTDLSKHSRHPEALGSLLL